MAIAQRITDKLKDQYPEFREEQLRTAVEEVVKLLEPPQTVATPEEARREALIDDIIREHARLKAR
jgi:hypothetical protein